MLDGEVVAVGDDGRPNFNLLQNYRTAKARIIYYPFDLLFHDGREMMRSALSERRGVLRDVITPSDHLGISQVASLSADQMMGFVRANGLEGVVWSRRGRRASISLDSEQGRG